MTHTGTRDPNKSLPADIRMAFEPRTYLSGLARLHRNADVVQQSSGVSGLGCSVDDDFTGCDYTSTDLSLNPFYTPDPSSNPYLQDSTPILGAGLQTKAPAMVIPPASSGGVDMTALLKIIQAGTAGLVPIIAATSSGVLYKVDPKTGAMTVYSQPSGSNVNLPIGGSIGTFTGPFGSANVSGFSGSTLALLAVAGVLAVMSFRR